MVIRAADPDHIPDQDHVRAAWIAVETEDLEEEAAMIVARITNQDLVEAVDVEAIEISGIIAIFAIVVVDVEKTEDGWAMVEVEVSAAAAVGDLVAGVFVVVNEGLIDVREVALTTVWIASVVPLIAIRVQSIMEKIRTTKKLHHQQVLLLKNVGTRILK